jgi:hypothetical protein
MSTNKNDAGAGTPSVAGKSVCYERTENTAPAVLAQDIELARQWRARNPLPPLLRELLSANRQAQQPERKAALALYGLGSNGGHVWGCEHVSTDGPYYSPAPDGAPAVILPAFQDGELVDLVAVDLLTRAARTRLGIAACLGFDSIERARFSGERLRLYDDPLRWFCVGMRGAVLLDWTAARIALGDVQQISCSSDALAEKLDRAMRQIIRLPKIFVREVPLAAA